MVCALDSASLTSSREQERMRPGGLGLPPGSWRRLDPEAGCWLLAVSCWLRLYLVDAAVSYLYPRRFKPRAMSGPSWLPARMHITKEDIEVVPRTWTQCCFIMPCAIAPRYHPRRSRTQKKKPRHYPRLMAPCGIQGGGGKSSGRIPQLDKLAGAEARDPRPQAPKLPS